jgi:hypothetical protein
MVCAGFGSVVILHFRGLSMEFSQFWRRWKAERLEEQSPKCQRSSRFQHPLFLLDGTEKRFTSETHQRAQGTVGNEEDS